MPVLRRFDVARDDANADSDVDVLVEFAPEAHVGLIAFVALEQRLAELLGHKVDLVSRRGLDPDRHGSILRDAVAAF
jgi:predicted nucleotidyltransferase